MAATAENEYVEYFYFRLVGVGGDDDGEWDYVPYGLRSPIFKGTFTQANDEAERFRYEEDENATGVCVYAKRDNVWQKIASYLGQPDYF